MKNAILLYLAAFLTAPVSAATRLVPDQYPTIKAAIDDANDGDVVIVADGTYTGDGNRDIDFKGKAITVRSERGPRTCVIDCQGSRHEFHRGFYFHSGEDANSVLQGFTVTGGFATKDGGSRAAGGGIYCRAASPRIADCVVTGNVAWWGGGIACIDSNLVVVNCVISANVASYRPSYWYLCRYDCGGGGVLIDGPHPMLINSVIAGNRAGGDGGGVACQGNFAVVNCTIYGNRTGQGGYGGGIWVKGRRRDRATLRNCILWGNSASACEQISSRSGGILGTTHLEIKYCTIQRDQPSFCLDRVEGSWTNVDPHFINPGHWDPNDTLDSPWDDFWVDGDYHLKSQAGRWYSDSHTWVKDDVTSPCIDAGDPNSPIGHEPFPNGGRINLGAYGGTAEASKSYFGEPPCETIVAGDLNGDCKVDFAGLALTASQWLEKKNRQ